MSISSVDHSSHVVRALSASTLVACVSGAACLSGLPGVVFKAATLGYATFSALSWGYDLKTEGSYFKNRNVRFIEQVELSFKPQDIQTKYLELLHEIVEQGDLSDIELPQELGDDYEIDLRNYRLCAAILNKSDGEEKIRNALAALKQYSSLEQEIEEGEAGYQLNKELRTFLRENNELLARLPVQKQNEQMHLKLMLTASITTLFVLFTFQAAGAIFFEKSAIGLAFKEVNLLAPSTLIVRLASAGSAIFGAEWLLDKLSFMDAQDEARAIRKKSDDSRTGQE